MTASESNCRLVTCYFRENNSAGVSNDSQASPMSIPRSQNNNFTRSFSKMSLDEAIEEVDELSSISVNKAHVVEICGMFGILVCSDISCC
jgi:hypothetical protein